MNWCIALVVIGSVLLAPMGCGQDEQSHGFCIPVGVEPSENAAIPANWSYGSDPDAFDVYYLRFMTSGGARFGVEVSPPGFLPFSDTEIPDLRLVSWLAVDRGEYPFIVWSKKYGSAVVLEFPAPHPSKPLAHIYLSGQAAKEPRLIQQVIGLRNALAAFTLKHGQEVLHGWRKVGEEPHHDSGD